jgi:hypothetical protein
MTIEGLFFFFIGKYAGNLTYPKQNIHKEDGCHFHLFWISEYKLNDRFMYLGHWYQVIENSLTISDELGKDTYRFYAKKIT